MALEAYSLAKDGGRRLSANFTVREFACRDGSDPVFIDTRLVQVLQSIRDHFGEPVVITSAYHTAAHNKAVGGAKYSQHCYGRAADIRVAGVTVERLKGGDTDVDCNCCRRHTDRRAELCHLDAGAAYRAPGKAAGSGRESPGGV